MNNDEDHKTLYVGNLSKQITEDILYELFLQAGPVNHVRIPVDKTTNETKGFGFVCFKDECSVPYAIYLLDSIRLFSRSLKVQRRRKEIPLPPIDCVGIHSLDPESQTYLNSSCTSPMPQMPNLNCSPLINTPPPCLMPLPPLQFPHSPFNNFQNYPGIPDARSIIDTKRMNELKNRNNHTPNNFSDGARGFGSSQPYNYNQHYDRNQYNRQDRYHTPNHTGSYDNGRNSHSRNSRNRRDGYYDNYSPRDQSHHSHERSDRQANSRSKSYREEERDSYAHKRHHSNRY